jgi:2-C-methyl-D-erythritol 4-phosphate cytidylyltransferase / 2-C-methyl-D-erythritol 2,4-cyclodiphosphate synthase
MPRVGLGYDSHRFQAGRELVLGGVKIDYKFGLAGHSDADAVLHAITDAILGAIGEADIGEQFPDTDPRWRNADSGQFLRHALELAARTGYKVENCDVTVLAEHPKLKDFKKAMAGRIAELLGVTARAVAVKAKTNEGMGWIGRGEGVAAIAVVMLTGK